MKNHQLITDYYIAHRDELLAFVSSRLGGSDLAEDIVQNVFLRLLTTDKMISEVTLPCLVYTVARNLISDYYRRHATFEEYEHYIKGVCSTEISTDSIFSVREVMEGLERGLARLPENCREVYRLHVYGGMKVSEISLRLGEGYKSVEHRLGTARKAMRQYMRQYA
ncbi:RNA polymerase sigma-70 factor, ECF subfamily [Prevotella aff. ruminicola Tc2-24]|jgi:RNA polymerase sigma-70 factor (ECF subfamily)|uniref:RNA polymerase sigma-70 factor, ECF subfamily n=1 Tax=Prevotella aff. ruminicola Tc2-24 TaxID=81582 RepID=A0A1I0NF71_9BACT|nr:MULTISPECIES: sigma-70 family RNA polymerase sigma factor [Prevotella]MBR5988357.1 sigma-70 family RNA polymerase sigma factor [Prevotella sp.]SEE29418.1 RNA polymerase sigma-70 factor, ECF subfamily [Prevotella sp. lc2012]SEW00089.1 RNA polymerase sigma-70 factor, ECF subfamily [Prevotella aff. ruminicola Tc2-24]